MKSQYALQYLLDKFEFDTVLDIGSGPGHYAKLFIASGKHVTTVDIMRIDNLHEDLHWHVTGDFNHCPGLKDVFKQFDVVWCAHCLEHQDNVGLFIQNVAAKVKCGGILALSVPPAKANIVGGHLTIWNAGLVIYNLVRQGIDCSNVRVKQQGYNITVIVPDFTRFELPELVHDCGDIETLSQWFPKPYNFHGFDGNIMELNW